MNRFNHNNIFVEYRDGVTQYEPVYNRKYTLTHSDQTGELFLTIGMEYAYDKVGILRDEVLAEWKEHEGYPCLYVYVYINGQTDPMISARRNEIFRRELPLALWAISYGDRTLFETYPDLKNAPIWIYFDSQDTEFHSFEYWGTLMDYHMDRERFP